LAKKEEAAMMSHSAGNVVQGHEINDHAKFRELSR